jgi:hypothetical protein
MKWIKNDVELIEMNQSGNDVVVDSKKLKQLLPFIDDYVDKNDDMSEVKQELYNKDTVLCGIYFSNQSGYIQLDFFHQNEGEFHIETSISEIMTWSRNYKLQSILS